jgi:hypothetical protein
MKHPPYHLRPNKAVDRFLLIEAIRLLGRKLGELKEYTYYGFGGPYLEEFRLLYEYFPEVKMVSIEEDENTFKRQKFHLPCGTLRLVKDRFKSFLAQYDSNDKKSIFWLDYTHLEYGAFEDFMDLLGKVADNSIVKVTLRAEPSDYNHPEKQIEQKKAEEFRAKFGALMSAPPSEPPRDPEKFAGLIQKMLQVAAQKALPSVMPRTYQPLSSFSYTDGVGMFTLTGIVCLRNERKQVRETFKSWPFANLNWSKPKRIDVPFLSTKERLHLQQHLPCRRDAGKTLLKKLGYLVDNDKYRSVAKLGQYADFHRYFPHFMRGIP